MFRRFTAVAACGALALVAAGCGSSSSSNTTAATAASTATSGTTTAAAAAKAACPNGQLTFGVEPYDTSPKFSAAYKALASDLSGEVGCPVKLFVTQTYTAEVEAMRAGKLDIGEFGPLGYVFAHKLAQATPVAAFGDAQGRPIIYYAGIWVPKSSKITRVADLRGKTLALADPASASGSLYPLYALLSNKVNRSEVKIKYAGGHPASMLALTHGKADAAEVNTQQQATATAAGQFDPSKYREIWKSTPIENDPITVRAGLPAGLQTAITKALLKLTPAQLAAVDKELGVDSGPMVAAADGLYSGIRDVANTEKLDISAIG